ncbi:MAG: hypothetical protein ACR2HR_03815, partial [Euzebya sp.]
MATVEAAGRALPLVITWMSPFEVLTVNWVVCWNSPTVPVTRTWSPTRIPVVLLQKTRQNTNRASEVLAS